MSTELLKPRVFWPNKPRLLLEVATKVVVDWLCLDKAVEKEHESMWGHEVLRQDGGNTDPVLGDSGAMWQPERERAREDRESLAERVNSSSKGDKEPKHREKERKLTVDCSPGPTYQWKRKQVLFDLTGSLKWLTWHFNFSMLFFTSRLFSETLTIGEERFDCPGRSPTGQHPWETPSDN